jgi:hypothetical protein
MELLTRDSFREAVFQRDQHHCVICKKKAADAHHIIERRLWPDGGYYIGNGASLCPTCHIDAESTVLSVEDIREAAGITALLIPPHLYPDVRYDKWGNPFQDNGRRMIGELFYDESVQKILQQGNMLGEFDEYIKYPRTFHLPWSPGVNSDDRVLTNLDFLDKEVVVTVKMDGENTSMYNGYLHARSIDGRNHVSRNWVKNMHAKIGWEIPSGWRICGENLWAEHSIPYDDLESYFMGFSIWDKDMCLGWDETLEWFDVLGITPVQEIFRGRFDREAVESVFEADKHEGYVVRSIDSFRYKDFRHKVGKFVRADHVQTRSHWFFGSEIKKNSVREENDIS